MVIESSMTIHCVHCPDYNLDNMYDLTAIHGKQVDDVKLAGKKVNGMKFAKAIEGTLGKGDIELQWRPRRVHCSAQAD